MSKALSMVFWASFRVDFARETILEVSNQLIVIWNKIGKISIVTDAQVLSRARQTATKYRSGMDNGTQVIGPSAKSL